MAKPLHGKSTTSCCYNSARFHHKMLPNVANERYYNVLFIFRIVWGKVLSKGVAPNEVLKKQRKSPKNKKLQRPKKSPKTFAKTFFGQKLSCSDCSVV